MLSFFAPFARRNTAQQSSDRSSSANARARRERRQVNRLMDSVGRQEDGVR